MNGQPTNGVWGYALAGGRQVAVGVWGYAGLGTRQPAAVTEGMKQFNQILRPKRAPGGEIFARSASRLTIFPVSNPPPLSRLRPGPPPLSALSVRRRDHPPWSRYLESIFTIWENGSNPPLRFKVKGYNVSYVRYMQVWSLRGMGVCSGRCVEARIWGMRVCRSVILVARSYPTPHLTEILVSS